jgi:creatinine amidohydrolase/Fe(II)-dependent formamide hydrolase-like protein
MAPLIPFGCSTPFISFPGAAGVKPRTFVNMLCEILHAYVFQGVNRIFLVSTAPFNRAPAAEALRRMEIKYRGIKTAFFDINTLLRDNVGVDFDRDDGLILSILSYIRQKQPDDAGGRVNGDICGAARPRPPAAAQYKTWKKRGKDPQKFKAICPDGLILSPDNDDISAERGRDCFNRITGIIHEKIKVL